MAEGSLPSARAEKGNIPALSGGRQARKSMQQHRIHVYSTGMQIMSMQMGVRDRYGRGAGRWQAGRHKREGSRQARVAGRQVQLVYVFHEVGRGSCSRQACHACSGNPKSLFPAPLGSQPTPYS